MRAEREELVLFEAACADPGNRHAQELLNVFGADTARSILDSLPAAPLALITDVVGQIWRAINEARSDG